jgi:hypothetical protein
VADSRAERSDRAGEIAPDERCVQIDPTPRSGREQSVGERLVCEQRRRPSRPARLADRLDRLDPTKARGPLIAGSAAAAGRSVPSRR